MTFSACLSASGGRFVVIAVGDSSPNPPHLAYGIDGEMGVFYRDILDLSAFTKAVSEDSTGVFFNKLIDASNAGGPRIFEGVDTFSQDVPNKPPTGPWPTLTAALDYAHQPHLLAHVDAA